MSEAPERVWLTHPWQMSLVSKKRTVEYVRADKLEELAAEVTLTATQRDKWIEAAMVQQRKRGKAEAALAEKDKEIAALREALEPFALEYEARARLAPGPDIDHWPIGGSALTYKHIRIAYEASRNAGGKDAE